jgi:hypothetical protein
MEPLLQGSLVLIMATGLIGVMAGLVYLLGTQRQFDARAMSALGRPLGLQFRVFGHRVLRRPEPFILNERIGVAAETCFIERSLAGAGRSGLPALFEYISYRDRARGRKMGSPILVLALSAPAQWPAFRLRPRTLHDGIALADAEIHWTGTGRWRPWLLRGSDPRRLREFLDPQTLAVLVHAGLWVQVADGMLFLARVPRPWRRNAFSPRGIEPLLRQAVPVLEALRHPDRAAVQALLPALNEHRG